MAKETPDDRPVFWLNNEGKGRVIKATTYRAALKTDRDGLIGLGAKDAAELYAGVVGGADRIRIYDIHGRDYKFLERLIDEQRPAVVFFDMLDNVHGFGDAARTDLRLESLYQWARESAVIYDFLSIPTSQISVEGEGLAWCDQSMLKDSKTAKQGACDAIVTMGAKNGPEWANSRFLYVPKVFKGQPAKGYRADCCREVHFDANRCQFTETAPPDADIPV
jgi:replicative DNA helicase